MEAQARHLWTREENSSQLPLTRSLPAHSIISTPAQSANHSRLNSGWIDGEVQKGDTMEELLLSQFEKWPGRSGLIRRCLPTSTLCQNYMRTDPSVSTREYTRTAKGESTWSVRRRQQAARPRQSTPSRFFRLELSGREGAQSSQYCTY